MYHPKLLYYLASLVTCPQTSYPGKKVGFVTNPQINEASGLVASQTHSDLFWTLNDSDGPNCIYALAQNGTLVLTLCLEYAENFDWESIATAPCNKNQPTEMCIYIGDTGDNEYKRKYISLYKVKEPKNMDNLEQKTIFTKDWDVVHFHYPNNQAHNAESILIDSKNREFIIVTKSAEPPYAKVFKTDLDSELVTYNVMIDTGITLALSEATDATSSKDGQVIIIRLYEGAFLWPRRNHQKDFSIVEILKEQECLISVGIQRQGESVALNPEGNSYFTHSEFVNQTLWKFDILEESYQP